MTTEKEKKKENEVLKADPKTLHTTDPQDNMEGPISSLVQTVKESVDEDVTKEEADKKKEENM